VIEFLSYNMSDRFRILIVDDESANLLFIEKAVKAEGHITKTCDNGKKALQIIKSWAPHLVILDVNMPQMSGLEVLSETRKLDEKKGEYTGVILVTANAEIEEITKGLDSGADDYIVKPFKIRELKSRAMATLRMKNVHDELLFANKRLKELTIRDDLTGLYNMGYTLVELDKMIKEAAKNDNPISCVMLDMDNFKHVNDNYGHLAGSELLVGVSKMIKSMVSSSDIAARFGGDEFMIVLNGVLLSKATDLAERIRNKFEITTFPTRDGAVNITASFGVSGGDSAEFFKNISSRILIKAADDALYEAKHKGKNNVKVGSIKVRPPNL